jgi:hypothetical protein
MIRSMSAAAVLLALLAQSVACQPETAPGPTPDGNTPTPSPTTSTSPFSLASALREPDLSTEPPPGNNAFVAVLTPSTGLASSYFHYDAYVVTARESGTVKIQSDVLESQRYAYGYGYPLSMTSIKDGISLTAYGGNYIQNALETGTAIMDYPVVAGRQYILVYKTFSNFTPLTYRLTLPSMLKVEGRIHALPEPVIVPTSSTGDITLENPRPDRLHQFVDWLGERVRG